MRRRKKLGIAFAGEVAKVTSQFGHFKRAKIADINLEDGFVPGFEPDFDAPFSSWRLAALAVVFLVAFFGLFTRIFHLQVVTGPQNRVLADSNRVQVRIIHAPRGVIYDRSGKVLAENNPGFRLKGRFLSRDEALKLEASADPASDSLEIDAVRAYPEGVVNSHVLGYVGEINGQELAEQEYTGYRMGDRVGRSGVEQVYEPYLKGRDGAEIVEVDAEGRKVRSLKKIPAVPGQNVHLAVDADLQKVVFESLKKKLDSVGSCCGTALVQDPKTGEVLAIVSYPAFDANAFNDPARTAEAQEYFSAANSPLLNRAIGGAYPPGSTFKITSALAGLSSGNITKETRFEDTGVVSLGPYTFANWYFTQHGKKEGLVDVVKALQRSNDTFFYRLGQMVGLETLAQTAGKLGMGKQLGIDLPGEASGLVPSNQWKQEQLGEMWYPGDTLHLAIGQGFLLATPLWVTAQTSFAANEGQLMKPYLAAKISRPDGSEVKQFLPRMLAENIFSKAHLKLVQQGLEGVPKPGGTAWPFFTFSIPTAGKTGTAEFGHPKGKTHAWYTAYAPVGDPQVTVTVLVEAGGEGSSVAAPVAKEILTWYFNPDKTNIKSLDIFPPATSSAQPNGQ